MKDHIQKLFPSIVGLIETKAKPSKSFRITKSLPANWNHTDNYDLTSKGRIWLSWMQQITVRAINKGRLDIVLSIVYGENWWSLREQL